MSDISIHSFNMRFLCWSSSITKINTSDFVPNSLDVYRIKNYDSNNYIYNISISDQENSVINLTFTTFKNHPTYEFFAPNIIIIRENGVISANNKLTFIHVERKKVS